MFVTANTRIIDALKLLLVGFEDLSGLKINLTKSELIPLNLSGHEDLQYANILGCKISSFTINYLDVPLH
jgi:hypothetical protein